MALRIPGAVAEARRALTEFRAEAVLGLGGLASFPAAVAARTRGLAVGLLEINAVPGRATRWLRPIVGAVFVAFDEAARAVGPKAILTGTPLRQGFVEPPAKGAARAALGLDAGSPALLVLGGSQGSAAVNGAAESLLGGLAKRGVQLIWICGPGRDAAARSACARIAGLRAAVFDYVEDASAHFAAADAALCRSGAATVAELAAMALPTVAIPYPHHRDRQQFRNAAALGAGAVILEERALDTPALADAVFSIFENESRRVSMANASRAAARPSAARDVADAIERLARPAQP
jgi:UDP-N-acetylglucosamine:LPS N-acetylglucosamine transferase